MLNSLISNTDWRQSSFSKLLATCQGFIFLAHVHNCRLFCIPEYLFMATLFLPRWVAVSKHWHNECHNPVFDSCATFFSSNLWIYAHHKNVTLFLLDLNESSICLCKKSVFSSCGIKISSLQKSPKGQPYSSTVKCFLSMPQSRVQYSVPHTQKPSSATHWSICPWQN